MLEKSTIPAITAPVLLTIEQVAERLDTSVEVLKYLAARRLVPARRWGATYRFHVDDVPEMMASREQLLTGLTPEALLDWRLLAFEATSISATELSHFLGIRPHEVRSLLGLEPRERIDKDRLWSLIVQGVDRISPHVIGIERRLEIMRRQRMTRISKPMRAMVRDRDGDICRYCGSWLLSIDIVLDHVIPKSRDGTDKVSNLVVACVPCNARKRDRLPHEAGMRLLPARSAGPARVMRVQPLQPYPDIVLGLKPKRRRRAVAHNSPARKI
jgi:5-methylcytosine-specific restriction endonuclease McrA